MLTHSGPKETKSGYQHISSTIYCGRINPPGWAEMETAIYNSHAVVKGRLEGCGAEEESGRSAGRDGVTLLKQCELIDSLPSHQF